MHASPRIRPRRSVLYMPGANVRAMEKARSLPADCLIFDLEDAVSPDAKELARRQVADALATGGYGHREVLVRANGLDTPWASEDLAMAAQAGADGIVLPKVESAETIHEAARQIHAAGGMNPLWAMIETPRGVLEVAEIAAAGEHLVCLLMGTSDLAKDLRLPTETPVAGLVWSLAQSLVAARAHGLDVIDGVHLQLTDAEGFKSACKRARAYGFDGKSLIHPSQIDIANATFGPAEGEVAHAHAVVAAYEAARVAGDGITVLNGQLIESLHVEQAKRLLALAAAIGAQ